MVGVFAGGVICLIALVISAWGIQSLVKGKGWGEKALGILLLVMALGAILFLFFGLPAIYENATGSKNGNPATHSSSIESVDALMAELLFTTNQISDVLESVVDDATAEQAAPKLIELSMQYQALRTRGYELERTSRESRVALEEKYEQRIREAGQRSRKALQKAVERGENNAAFRNSLKELKEAYDTSKE